MEPLRYLKKEEETPGFQMWIEYNFDVLELALPGNPTRKQWEDYKNKPGYVGNYKEILVYAFQSDTETIMLVPFQKEVDLGAGPGNRFYIKINGE